MNLISQFFGGVTQMWLNVAFIVCVFGVLCFRPERIARPRAFHGACFVFALSLIMPSVTMFVLTMPEAGRRGNPFAEPGLLEKIFSFLGPLLFAIAFLMAVGALCPRPGVPTQRSQSEEQ